MNKSSSKCELYTSCCFNISKEITKRYSTSFYSATSLFPSRIRKAIYSVYGFVRVADEIVDSFHDSHQEEMLIDFEKDYYKAYREGISTNPILHSFQITVKEYEIPDAYIRAFLKSMKTDLNKKEYETEEEIKDYIYGSADVVGLMCLKIFCMGDGPLFEALKNKAMRLGSAFQKVNFLRDLNEDYTLLGRLYFPGVEIDAFSEDSKYRLVADVEKDFKEALDGIRMLPKSSRLAVFTAYRYYLELLRIIKKTPARKLLSKRVRVSGFKKMIILFSSMIKNKFNAF